MEASGLSERLLREAAFETKTPNLITERAPRIHGREATSC